MKVTNALRAMLFSVTVMAAAMLSAGELVLGVEGQSKHQVVVPEKIENEKLAASVDAAAKLVQTAFASNGIALKIVKESEKDPGLHGIYLGATEFAKKNGVDFSKIRGGAFVHKAVGKDVIVAGADLDEPLSRRGAKIEQGTLFSAGEFLYRYAGARYLQADADGIEFLPKKIIYIPDDLNMVKEPFFKEHLLWGSVPGNIYFYILQHADSWRRIGGSSHHIISVITLEKYGKTHPEYFAMHNGLRVPEQGNARDVQVCYSNPEVRELAYKDILEQFDQGYEIVADGQPDGYSPCQCKACEELYGVKPATKPIDGINYLMDPAWGEKLWIMHREFAERLLKDRPGKKFMIIAYGPAVHPPTTFDTFPANTLIHMAHSDAENFERWSKIKGVAGYAVYYYPFNGTGYMPKNTVNSFAEDMERFVKYNARIINIDMPPLSSRTTYIDGPAHYAYYRLGIDPEYKTPHELFDEYVEAAFLEAADPMRKFFANLQLRVDARRQFATYMKRAPAGCDSMFIVGAFWPVDYIVSLDETLSKAEKAAVTPRVQRRIAKVRDSFDYLKHVSFVIHEYRGYLKDRDKASLDRLIAALEARNAQIAALAGKNEETRKRLLIADRTLDRAPFNWDLAKVKKEGLVEDTDKDLEVARAHEKPTLDSKCWDGLEAVPFVESKKYAKGKINAQTSFKLLYDDDSLYVRVSAEQPKDLMQFVNRGRDAELWHQECIVVNLSPKADKSQYYYFTYEPLPGCFNDARHGFILDQNHPRFGWNDESWNGEWTYESKLLPEAGRWESMAVFPFKTLGAAAPKTGEEWNANFGRVHYFTDENGKKGREQQVWNGNLNMSQITGDASMGIIRFK
ncbi:MAG: DUF4838 domain-containing protein [Kiritimatiellia bacterium]